MLIPFLDRSEFNYVVNRIANAAYCLSKSQTVPHDGGSQPPNKFCGSWSGTVRKLMSLNADHSSLKRKRGRLRVFPSLALRASMHGVLGEIVVTSCCEECYVECWKIHE